MERLAATRMGLLAVRARRGVAEKGVALLRSKREALANEFFRLMQGVLAGRDHLDDELRRATTALVFALGLDGEPALLSLAHAAGREVPLTIHQRKVWGVPTPTVSAPALRRNLDGRGVPPTSVSLVAAEAALAHERALEVLLDLCSSEIHLTRVGEEIRKTSRRINALEQLVIPRLSKAVRRIATALEEHEREDLSRLKRFKDSRARRQHPGSGRAKM